MALARGSTRSGLKVTFDPTCNVQLAECKVGNRTIGIVTAYIPWKAEGPMRIHTQCLNRIRALKLKEEPIDVRAFIYEQIETMSQKVLDGGGDLIIGGDFQEEDRASSEMTKLMSRLGLENACDFHEGDPPPTYSGGRQTITASGCHSHYTR